MKQLSVSERGRCRSDSSTTYAHAAYVSIRQHTAAYGSIRQHTSAYVSIRPMPLTQLHNLVLVGEVCAGSVLSGYAAVTGIAGDVRH